MTDRKIQEAMIMLQSKRFHFLIVLPVLALLLTVGGCKKQEAGESSFFTDQPKPYLITREIKVRNGPGTQYQVVAEIKSGTKVNVVGREGDWLKIISKHGNPPGYIDKRFARPGKVQSKKPASLLQGSYTTLADTHVRKGPGLHYEVIARIAKGMKVRVVNAEGDWLKVQSKHGNPPGYIEKRYAQRRPGR